MHTKKTNSKRGAFSVGLCALAVAAVLLFNLLVGQLPSSITAFDMSGSGIYNITDTTRDYLAGLDQDIVIHVLQNRDSMDSRIVRFLDKYEDLSDHLTVEYIDPVVYPSALSQYGVEANTIVVEGNGRQETIDIGDIIGFDMMSYYYSGTYTETDFDAEGLLLSAIDGVMNESGRKLYETTGHDETAMSVNLEEEFKKVHMSVEVVNLLTEGGIPADCDVLLINGPERDFAADEITMLRDFLSGGGQVVLAFASQLETLENLEGFCAEYGIRPTDGLIADTSRCYQNNPYLFFPQVDSSVDAASALSSDALVLWYASRGFTLTDPQRDTVTVSSFLTTSDQGYSVAADGTKTQGTYVVGAVAEEDVGLDQNARLTVLGSDSLTNSDLTATFPNVDNRPLFMQAITCGFAELSGISVQPVSLSTPVNTISTGGLWSLLFIFVIPGALLICGFIRWMRRRKL